MDHHHPAGNHLTHPRDWPVGLKPLTRQPSTSINQVAPACRRRRGHPVPQLPDARGSRPGGLPGRSGSHHRHRSRPVGIAAATGSTTALDHRPGRSDAPQTRPRRRAQRRGTPDDHRADVPPRSSPRSPKSSTRARRTGPFARTPTPATSFNSPAPSGAPPPDLRTDHRASSPSSSTGYAHSPCNRDHSQTAGRATVTPARFAGWR